MALLGLIATLTLIRGSDSKAHMEIGDGSGTPGAGADSNGSGDPAEAERQLQTV